MDSKRNFIEMTLESKFLKPIIAIIGVVSAIIGIYAFFQERKPDLRFEIISNTNVLNFNANLNKLDVFYDSTNLKQTNEDLRVYTLRVVNEGNENILTGSFDKSDPVRIEIASGKIIEKPEVIQASNGYIKSVIKELDYTQQKVVFPQFILESKEFVVVKLLVLHKKGKMPGVYAYGKIAGQKNISIVHYIEINNDSSFLSQAFKGSVSVQFLRLFSYSLALVILIATPMIISNKIDNYTKREKIKKIVLDFKNVNKRRYTRMEEGIFDIYKNEGSYLLKRMSDCIADEVILNDRYKRMKEDLNSANIRTFNKMHSSERGPFRFVDDWTLINDMVDDGFIIKENDKLLVNQAMKETLDSFVAFLVERGELEFLKTDRFSSRIDLKE